MLTSASSRLFHSSPRRDGLLRHQRSLSQLPSLGCKHLSTCKPVGALWYFCANSNNTRGLHFLGLFQAFALVGGLKTPEVVCFSFIPKNFVVTSFLRSISNTPLVPLQAFSEILYEIMGNALESRLYMIDRLYSLLCKKGAALRNNTANGTQGTLNGNICNIARSSLKEVVDHGPDRISIRDSISSRG